MAARDGLPRFAFADLECQDRLERRARRRRRDGNLATGYCGRRVLCRCFGPRKRSNAPCCDRADKPPLRSPLVATHANAVSELSSSSMRKIKSPVDGNGVSTGNGNNGKVTSSPSVLDADEIYARQIIARNAMAARDSLPHSAFDDLESQYGRERRARHRRRDDNPTIGGRADKIAVGIFDTEANQRAVVLRLHRQAAAQRRVRLACQRRVRIVVVVDAQSQICPSTGMPSRPATATTANRRCRRRQHIRAADNRA